MEDRMSARRKLTNRRASEMFSFAHAGMRYDASLSRYDDGRVGEIFLSCNKTGSSADVAAKDSAILCSVALQCGASLDTLRKALHRDGRGNPASALAAALDIIAGC
jgi:hypothetical protein